MKIIYYAHSVLSRGGDKMILAHLGHLARSGHEVTIRTTVVDTVFPIDCRIGVELLPFRSKGGTLVAALWHGQEADCVIATIVPTAVPLALRNRGRVLLFAQDDNETAYDSAVTRFLVRALYRAAFSWLLLPTVAVSRALADRFEDAYGARCTVVPNGVDTGVFYPAPAAERIAPEGRRRSMLLYSRCDRRKGFDVAKQVVALLPESVRRSLQVWTVGEPCASDEFDCDHRHFGNVDEKTLRVLMSSADVFLYPSRSEGFPLMVVEAFACRCPVVTSEAVTFAADGVNALVSRVEDVSSLARQVVQLLDDQALAERIADGGLRFAGEHRLDASSERFHREVLLVAGNDGEGAAVGAGTFRAGSHDTQKGRGADGKTNHG